MAWFLRFHGSEALLSCSQYADGGVGVAAHEKSGHRTQLPPTEEFLLGLPRGLRWSVAFGVEFGMAFLSDSCGLWIYYTRNC